jgi:Dolichyl-phosphate-mannose-protein mannosyltransferase
MSSPVVNGPLPKQPPEDKTTMWAGRGSTYLRYALLALVILLFAAVRYRLRDMPLERDEGEYAYAGQLLLQGVPPYQLAYNMKLPGTYVAYAAIMAIFGETDAGIHIGVLIVNAITTLLMFFLARRFFGRTASLIAAASYALLSTSPTVLGLEGHATHFVVLFGIAGLLLLLNGLEKENAWWLFGAGCLLGVAFLMKQPGISFPIFGAAYLLKREWKRLPSSSSVSRIAAYTLGAVLPFGITCLVLYRTGVFHKFWFWTFSYARVYAANVDLRHGLENLYANAIGVVRPAAVLWIIALVGLTSPLWNSPAKRFTNFLYGLLLFSFLAVCPGLYFRPHYFIVLLPVVSLLVASAVSSATNRLAILKGGRLLAGVPIVVFVLAFLGTILVQREPLFVMDPISACRWIYPKEPFVELVGVAKYIQSQTSTDQHFEVLGADPQTYFYAQRRSVSGYMYIYPLTEDQPYAEVMQRELISNVVAARPEFIVWVYDWDVAPGPRQLILAWMARYLQTNYSAVNVIMQPDSGGGDPSLSRHRTPMIAVFRRRA